MKSKILRRGIAVLLSLITAVSIISVPLTASARYTDEDIENKISYHQLNCREDDCDCLEPENDRFAVVSPSSLTNTYNEYILVDTYQNVQKYFNEQGWTDGLPIVPPTWIKAEKFMRYTPYSDNDVVATVNGRNVTAYQVAVNAIMSGCSAEYLPVCIAFVEALGDTDYLDSLRSGELTPMMYVNGPIARQLGIDNGQGMTTEECNIAIARFMELALINLAGLERTNAFGNVQPLVFSEDEKNCINIGWNPHHVEEGFDLNDNVITATSFAMWGNNVTPATDLPEEIMKVMAWDITEKNLGGLGGASIEDNADAKRTILITPSVAQALAKKYKSKDALENALVENARRPLWMRTYAYYYANIGGALSKSFTQVYNELKAAASEDAKLTASPAWMNGITYSNIDTVATMTKGNTAIIIQGDESRNKTQVMPGGVAVSKEIRLDTTWDDLLASMVISIVYQPLSAHYISPVDNSVKLPTADGIPTELQVTKQTTYTVAASANYAKSKNRIYYDASSGTLYYGDGTTAHTVVLDTEKYADFISLVETIGRNGTIKLNNKNAVTAVSVAFKTNINFPDQNIVNYTDDTFKSVPLTVQAVSTTQSSSLDGAFITMSADLTTFTADLGGDIVMGDSTDAGFVTVSGTTVTVNPDVPSGATAVIGSSDGNGTYKTMTIVNGGDGTYKITYNNANTLTLTASSYYLKGTFNNWSATDPFVKTDNDDILTVIKDIPAGTYTLKVHNAGADVWYGNSGTISDTANRWTMDSSSDCTFEASGGAYEFKYEISTNKLSVYTAQTTVTCKHTNVETLSAVAATCTDTGLTEGKKCADCGEIITAQTVISAKGHTEITLVAKPSTCTEAGLTERKKCSVCGTVTVAQLEVPLLAHNWSDGTCTNCGTVCNHIYTDGKCTVCGKIEHVSKLEGYSISLSGNIAVNFFMTLNEYVLEDESAKVVFTLPNGSKKSAYVKNATVTDEGYYTFTCEVAAKEMSKIIKVQIVTSAGKGEMYEYSVQQYAEYIIDSSDAKYESAKPLVKAMLNYGAAAQEYFKYNTENLANKNLSDEEKVLKDVDLSGFGYNLTGKEDGVSYYGSKLSLESETAIKHYFYIENEDNIPTITVNNIEVTAKKVGSYYEVKISDILAQNLDVPIVVKAGNLTLGYNAFSYGYLAMQGDDTSLQNVIKALFAYNQAADAYINIA